MFFSKSKLIAKLKAEIQSLREALARTEGERDSLQRGYDGMKDIAARAIEAAKEKPQQQEDVSLDDLYSARDDLRRLNAVRSRPDYKAPEEKHCPECSVSVRAETWPQECPSCHCTFGFPES